MLSVIIINYNTWQMTEKAIRNFLEMEKNLNAEIILIDNGSTEEIAGSFFDELKIRFIKNESNLGFAKAVNRGIRISSGEFILLLNSDVLIEKETVSAMIDFLDKDGKAGIISPKLIYPNGKTQASFGNFPTLGCELMQFSMWSKIFPGGSLIYENIFTKSMFKDITKVDWVTGGMMLIRRKVIDQIGLMDENYFFGVEDIDFCMRARRAGWDIIYYPKARAIHYHGFSSGGKRSTFGLEHGAKGMDYFYRKFFPKKAFSRKIIGWLFKAKIFILRTIHRCLPDKEGLKS